MATVFNFAESQTACKLIIPLGRLYEGLPKVVLGKKGLAVSPFLVWGAGASLFVYVSVLVRLKPRIKSQCNRNIARDQEIQELRAQVAEERRRREDAERAAASATKQNLLDFLEGCHALSSVIKPITDSSSATGGSTTTPTDRFYPQRILPWNDFPTLQRSVWDQLAKLSFCDRQVFPSHNDLNYVRSVIDPITSEDDLRYVVRLAVENMAKNICDEIGKDEQTRTAIDMKGKISFENQASFQQADVDH